MLIYKHTNIINGLSYIGLTKRTMEERWNEHVNSSKQQITNFQKAIVEYGSSNFSSEILERCCSVEELYTRERYWIKHFDTTNNGYNMKIGTDVNIKHEYQIKEIKPITETLAEALEELILRNKNIINKKFKLMIDYFNLRIQQEDKLYKISLASADKIKENRIKLKIAKNISMEKIHKYAVKYKKTINSYNIDVVNLVFDDLISEFEYNTVIHYVQNKDIIMNYITDFFRLNLYTAQIKKEMKLELNKFKNTLSSVESIRLVYEYNIFKRNVKDFKIYLLENEGMTKAINEIFLEEVNKIESNRTLNKICKENIEEDDSYTK